MLDGVFDQRLQDEAGHESITRVFVHLDLDLELPLKSDLHDLEIALQKLDLLGQHDLVLISAIECVAEQLTKSRNHAPHSAGVALNQ